MREREREREREGGERESLAFSFNSKRSVEYTREVLRSIQTSITKKYNYYNYNGKKIISR